jgi:hypothetical protein
MKATKLSVPMENFTITFDKTGSGCTMRAEWENSGASVNISK